MSYQDFFRPMLPGFEGKRYALCSDGTYHLVLKIHHTGMTDTLCASDVTVIYPEPARDESPMCESCVDLHFGKPRT